jgi:5-methylcytosine-specific restriction endonuclease McrA
MKKRCYKCDTEFPATNNFFHRHQGRKDGLVNICKLCACKRVRNWYANNREHAKRRIMSAYRENPEPVKARAAAWYVENRERAIANCRRWQHANKDKVNAASRRYRKRHSNRLREIGRRARSKRANLPATLSETEWRFCLDYWNHKCIHCGNDENIEIDHWIPASMSGSPGLVLHNVIPLCRSCNSGKCAQLPGLWLAKKYGAMKASAIMRSVDLYFQIATKEMANV